MTSHGTDAGACGERRVRREERADALRWIALARSLAATLDLLPQPVVLVEPGTPLRVWHANSAARSRLASSELLPMRDGVLAAAGPSNTAALDTAVGQCLRHGPRYPQKLLLVGADGLTKTVRLQALEFGASADLPVSCLLMLEVQERFPPEHGRQRLCEQYQLTPKEAECAIGLYAVGSVDRFARCSGKSVHTVRTQLKAAMQKTATNTQAALVALVANILNA